MEVTSMVGLQAAHSVAGSDLAPSQHHNLFGRWRTARCRVSLNPRRSLRSLAIRAASREESQETILVAEKKKKEEVPGKNCKPTLFVGLPMDVVREGNTLNHGKAIAAGLKALKLLGVDGVELPFWWGIVESDAMGKHDWSAYLEISRMIRDAGLQIHASLCFHASKSAAIPLPKWVTNIGDADPNIYFTNKAGTRNKDCLSLSVDTLPVLNGKTPLHVYDAFFQSFRHSFADLMGSTITNVTIGLGPGGELRYPSLASTKKKKVVGVGEFHCYDAHMLSDLKKHADGSGNHYWGLSGPHDTPRGDQTPESGGFFKDQGGSWETPYGDFFLSWYSEQLLRHGDRVLSAAAAAFAGLGVTICARVPVAHAWYKTRSHALELTSGYHNAEGRDGYDAVAGMLAKHGCEMRVAGVDLADAAQPAVWRGSPESLVAQMAGACARHGVRVCGENLTSTADGLDKMKSGAVDSFVYQRMGASLFSPEHWPRFTEFVRGVGLAELHGDDLVSDGDAEVEKVGLGIEVSDRRNKAKEEIMLVV